MFRRSIVALQRVFADLNWDIGQQNYGQTTLKDSSEKRGSKAISLLKTAQANVENNKRAGDLEDRNSKRELDDLIEQNWQDILAAKAMRVERATAKAGMEEEMQAKNDELIRRNNIGKDLTNEKDSLDQSCEQLVQNYQKRRIARAGDRDNLIEAKATLESRLDRPFISNARPMDKNELSNYVANLRGGIEK